MVHWAGLRAARPDLADAGEELLYQFGVGLAFLATVRVDGGPRLHPMCPVLCQGGLYALLIPSPKRSDLLRDRRYSMHSFPTDDNEDAFYVSGDATPVSDSVIRELVVDTFLRERKSLGLVAADLDDQMVFEFDITTCLVTRTTGQGDPEAHHAVWHDDGA